jgi:hypothetical protein
VHAFQLWLHRPSWYFSPLSIGCAFEVVGYAFRTLSAARDPYNVIYYVVSYFFIVVAPVLLSAGIYAVLSVLIQRVGTASTPLIPPRIILAVFITCDVIATVVQIAGAAMIGKAESNREDPTTPNNILLAGLAFQVFSFAVFLLLLAIFVLKARRVAEQPLPRMFMATFVVAALLVYLRTCFRLAETAEGVFGALMTSEVLFGCLEFAPVALAVIIFSVWHPGRCIQRSEKKRAKNDMQGQDG